MTGLMSSSQKISTKDLWQSAFLLACGCDLVDIRLDGRTNGYPKREVSFTLSGENAGELSEIFRSGQASCHVGMLRSSMMHLKEEMYKVIRG